MIKLLSLALCLVASPAWAQVEVELRTEKPVFIAGEPVFVVAEIKNVGPDPVAYDGASGKPVPVLSVADGQRRVIKGLTGCDAGGVSGGGSGFVTHPPMLQPGASTTVRYLLRGYRLRPGKYQLRVAGSVDVAWREPDPFTRQGQPPSRPKHAFTEPVEGGNIDRTLPLTIVAASDDELRAVFAPYVKAAGELHSRPGVEAVMAILEMAPSLLEDEIVQLVKRQGHNSWVAAEAATALAEIGTESGRAELIGWFDRSTDLQVRASIVRALTRMRHPGNLRFLASLLPGRSTEADDRIRRDAALGIGMIGGGAAVAALRDAPVSPNPLVSGAVVLALGYTNSKSAVDVLIERAEGQKGYVSNDACTAFINLTHIHWCGGTTLARTQEKWRTWWAANRDKTRIYGPDECPERSTLPNIW